MQLQLPRKLKTFAKPDTASDVLGWAEAGLHDAVEVHHNGDTDFVQLADGAWVCTRWQARHYATLIADPGPRQSLVPERELVDRLAAFRGFRYELTGKSGYPHGLPGGVRVSTTSTHNNCCTFVEGLLAPGAAAHLGNAFAWGKAQHGKAMVLDAGEPFSSVDVWVDAGLATPADADALPEPWTVMQVWRRLSPLRGGHTLLILDVHAPTGRILTLESNKSFGLDGVGYRTLGMLRELEEMHPGSRWWDNTELPTWESFCSSYPHRRSARLEVGDIGWVASGPAEGVFTGPVSFSTEDTHEYVWDVDGGEVHVLTCPHGHQIPDERQEVGRAPVDRRHHDCQAVLDADPLLG